MKLKNLEIPLIIFGTIAQAQSGGNQFSSLQAALASNSSLSQFATLVEPYVSSINQSNFTLFVPNNAAVGRFLNSSAAAQFNDSSSVQALITYHAFGLLLSEVPLNFGRTTSKQLSIHSWLNETFFLQTRLTSTNYTSLTDGQLIELNPSSNGYVSINTGLLTNSRVLSDAITFDGGEMYIIDRVFTIPPAFSDVVVAFGLSSCLGATRVLSLTSIYDTYAQLNVYVPTNAAFSAVAGNLATLSTQDFANLIQYHAFVQPTGDDTYGVQTLLQGSNLTYSYADNNTVFVNNARVLAGNIFIKNGNIWIIDQVLNPDNTTIVNRTSCDDGLVAFASPSPSNAPYTSGIPTPTSTINTALATESLYSSASTYCPARPRTSSTSGSTTPKSSSTGQPSGSSSQSKKNIGAIVGGVVGGVGGLILIVLLIWCCKRRGYSLSLHRKQRPGETPQNDHDRKVDGPIILNPRAEMSADEKRRIELSNEERRLAEMAAEGNRLAEPSATVNARNADPSELEGQHHYWANNSPQQFQRLPDGTHTQMYEEPNARGGENESKSKSGNGFDSTSTQHYPSSSSAAGTESSTQPLVAAAPAAGMSAEMAFMRGLQHGQEQSQPQTQTPQSPRRKPVRSLSTQQQPISPIREGQQEETSGYVRDADVAHLDPPPGGGLDRGLNNA